MNISDNFTAKEIKQIKQMIQQDKYKKFNKILTAFSALFFAFISYVNLTTAFLLGEVCGIDGRLNTLKIIYKEIDIQKTYDGCYLLAYEYVVKSHLSLSSCVIFLIITMGLLLTTPQHSLLRKCWEIVQSQNQIQCKNKHDDNA